MSQSSGLEQLYQAAAESRQLPPPADAAIHHSEQLIARLHQRITEHGGRIPFHDYMQQVLYAPALGYYSAGSTKLGEAGDFVTAPELSPLFSYALANAILPQLALTPQILEVGAGQGTMAADMLLFLQQQHQLPAQYLILELSADLQQRQRDTIAAKVPEALSRVKWISQLPDAFSGVVLANELLDAMPVRLFAKQHGKIHELFVLWQNDGFVLQALPSDDERLLQRVAEIEQAQGELADGYVSEINFSAEDFIRSLAEKMQRGIMLFVDYGFPRHEYYHPQRSKGTLMCHYRHRAHANPFVYPGLQDITSHVDFTAMADAALDAGMQIIGYTNQAGFLMGAGMLQLAELDPAASAQQQLDITTQIKKLTLPHEMGELFKVIAFGKQVDVTLPALAFRDMREYL